MRKEALSEEGRKIFPRLVEFADFCLAGGTALALQIGHRASVDFDFFSKEPIGINLLIKVKKIFSDKEVLLSVSNQDELTVFIDKTKLTFIHYPFPFGDDCVQFQGINLLSPKEIAVTKAYTIGRRGSFRDYVDLYFVISENYAKLEEIVKMAEEKYGAEFNSRLFLEQLIYLKDIEDTNIMFLKNAVSKEGLEKFFTDKIKEIKL